MLSFAATPGVIKVVNSTSDRSLTAASERGRTDLAAREIRGLAGRVETGELARAKAQLKASLFMGRESLSARAEQAAAQQLIFGHLVPGAELARAIDDVSPDHLRALGVRLLSSRASVGAVLGPKGAMDAPQRFEAALFV